LVNGPNGQPVVVANANSHTGAGMLETLTASGMPQVRLFSSDTGGMLTTIERGGKLALILGDTGQDFGLFVNLPELGRLYPLIAPGRFGGKSSVPKPPIQPAVPGKTSDQQPPQKKTN
jgi:hypothetical protein